MSCLESCISRVGASDRSKKCHLLEQLSRGLGHRRSVVGWRPHVPCIGLSLTLPYPGQPSPIRVFVKVSLQPEACLPSVGVPLKLLAYTACSPDRLPAGISPPKDRHAADIDACFTFRLISWAELFDQPSVSLAAFQLRAFDAFMHSKESMCSQVLPTELRLGVFILREQTQKEDNARSSDVRHE